MDRQGPRSAIKVLQAVFGVTIGDVAPFLGPVIAAVWTWACLIGGSRVFHEPVVIWAGHVGQRLGIGPDRWAVGANHWLHAWPHSIAAVALLLTAAVGGALAARGHHAVINVAAGAVAALTSIWSTPVAVVAYAALSCFPLALAVWLDRAPRRDWWLAGERWLSSGPGLLVGSALLIPIVLFQLCVYGLQPDDDEWTGPAPTGAAPM